MSLSPLPCPCKTPPRPVSCKRDRLEAALRQASIIRDRAARKEAALARWSKNKSRGGGGIGDDLLEAGGRKRGWSFSSSGGSSSSDEDSSGSDGASWRFFRGD